VYVHLRGCSPSAFSEIGLSAQALTRSESGLNTFFDDPV
jgi:hypothetical protein